MSWGGGSGGFREGGLSEKRVLTLAMSAKK